MAETAQTIDEIRTLLRAQYPVIYLVTYEEDRAKSILSELCEEMSLDLYTWSFTHGVDQEGIPDQPEAANPIQALDKIKSHTTSAMFVMKDLHSYFNSHEVVRKLRDLNGKLSNPYRPIVITSPVLKIPTELEKLITVVDLSLPNAEEISEILEAGVQQIIRRREDIPSPSDEEKEKIIKACIGLTTEEIENVLAKSLVDKQRLDVKTILSEKKQIIRKSGILEYYDSLEDYANVGGMDTLKSWLEARGDALSDKARQFGLPQPKGVLLLGIPGSGKSLIAKAISGLWGIPLIRMDVGKIFAGIVGASEQNMRKAISTVESISPCVLMIS